jgi:hypothetical protein
MMEQKFRDGRSKGPTQLILNSGTRVAKKTVSKGKFI